MIGHLADYDTEGGDIADAFAEDAIAFSKWHREHESAPGSLSIVRLGLTRKQAQDHDLLDADGGQNRWSTCACARCPGARLDRNNLDPVIARSVVAAEPKIREDVARIAQRLVKKQSSSEQPDTGGEDWAWAR